MADTEAAIKRVIDRKADDHAAMKRAMAVCHARSGQCAARQGLIRADQKPHPSIMAIEGIMTTVLNQIDGDGFVAIHGDCC
jgi:hypothetical protein